MVEMNSIPWSPVLRYATPLPINRTPVSTVGGPFPPFCGTPHPSRSTGPPLRYAKPLPINRTPFRTWSVEHKAVSSVLRYARPRFHRLFRPSPPDEHNDAFRSDPAGWLPMNTTMMLFLCSDPATYTKPGRMYARVGVRDPGHMYGRGRIFFLAHWPLYVRVHAACAPLLRHVRASTSTSMYVHVRD